MFPTTQAQVEGGEGAKVCGGGLVQQTGHAPACVGGEGVDEPEANPVVIAKALDMDPTKECSVAGPLLAQFLEGYKSDPYFV